MAKHIVLANNIHLNNGDKIEPMHPLVIEEFDTNNPFVGVNVITHSKQGLGDYKRKLKPEEVDSTKLTVDDNSYITKSDVNAGYGLVHKKNIQRNRNGFMRVIGWFID